MNAYWLVPLSAVLHAYPFICPTPYSASVHFISLIPLYIFFTRSTAHAKRFLSFWWGVIFYALFFSILLPVTGSNLCNPYAWVAYPLLVLYGALTTLGWFVLCGKSAYYCGRWCSIVLTFWIMFLFNDYAFFIIFGHVYGNRLSNPLVCLASCPALLFWLRFLSAEILIGCLIATNAFFARMIIQPSRNNMLCVMACLLFWLSGMLFSSLCKHTSEQMHFFSRTCGVLQWHGSSAIQLWEKSIMLAQASAYLKKKFPAISYIIMPESTLNCSLYHHMPLLRSWFDYHETAITFIVGAYRRTAGALYNTLYAVQKKNMYWYDKQELLFFAEKRAAILKWLAIDFDFWITEGYITRGEKSRELIPGLECVPYICSEFFFAHRFTHHPAPILCIANDRWFSHSYAAQLMALYARFQAHAHQRVIIYCSYYYAYVIDHNGCIIPLSACVVKDDFC